MYLWEDLRLDPNGALVKVSAEIPDELQAVVEVEETLSLDTSLMLGVLWPVQVYRLPASDRETE